MKYIFTLLLSIALMAAEGQVRFTYHWRQVAGPVTAQIDNPDSASTFARGLNFPGEYLFEFAACNDFGCGYDTCKVTVLPSDVLAIDTTTKRRIERPVIRELEINLLEKSNEIWMEIKSPRVQKITVRLYNSLGQMLASADIFVKTGSNYASLPKPRIKGVYYIRFFTYFENVTHKLII